MANCYATTTKHTVTTRQVTLEMTEGEAQSLLWFLRDHGGSPAGPVTAALKGALNA